MTQEQLLNIPLGESVVNGRWDILRVIGGWVYSQLFYEHNGLCGADLVINSSLTSIFVPEPQPKFANIKVGDWVEGESENRGIVHREVSDVSSDTFAIGTKCDGYVYWYDFNGNCVTMLKGFKPIRILSPKEVIMDFSSGIVGTISKNSEFDWIFIHNTSGKHIASIRIKSLRPTTRAKVESLLKAQEEE